MGKRKGGGVGLKARTIKKGVNQLGKKKRAPAGWERKCDTKESFVDKKGTKRALYEGDENKE